jgi:hypothetical protein
MAPIEAAIAPEVLVRYRVHSGNQSQFIRATQQDLDAVVRNALLRKCLLNLR